MIEVLLVDDETYVTESLCQTIPWDQIGVSEVYQSSSAHDALSLLEQQSIDIVVTDIRMPEMDGLKLIEQISARWPEIHCILLTGHSDFEYAKKAIQLQAFDYLMKPVNDDEFVLSVTNAIESLKDKWEHSEKFHQLMYTMRSHLSILSADLLYDLLLGRRMSPKTIEEKLRQFEVNLNLEDECVMLLIQLGKGFTSLDHHSVSLIVYAIGNIFDEVFSGDFRIWHSKAPHDCLVGIITLKEDGSHPHRQERLQTRVDQLRQSVSDYLKGEISVVISDWFVFPDDIAMAYRDGLSLARLAEQGQLGNVVYVADQLKRNQTAIQSLETLYKPPTLIHLLESKQWDEAKQKIDHICEELESMHITHEHLYEVYFTVSNACMYIAHKQGMLISQISQSGFDILLDQSIFQSLESLRKWSFEMIEKLSEELSDNEQHTTSYIIAQVQKIVANELGQHTSVKTIAERVYLHPVYLSKIYKAETGESLGDYIIRTRMERALYLLKYTNKKIYEITTELGYQNPQYFSKMFRKMYGVTPSEFREQ